MDVQLRLHIKNIHRFLARSKSIALKDVILIKKKSKENKRSGRGGGRGGEIMKRKRTALNLCVNSIVGIK